MSTLRVAITGASGGLGTEFCKRFAKINATVDRIPRGDNLPQGIRYDLVFLNAGFTLIQSAREELHPDSLELFTVNLFRPILLAHQALAAGASHVHLISSTSALVPSPLTASYAATKAGLRAWAYSAFRELPGRVSISYPDGIRTNFRENFKGSPKLVAIHREIVDRVYPSYDDPSKVVSGILEGIAWGAREILPTEKALIWCRSVELDLRRMWYPGLQQPSEWPWEWWAKTQVFKVHF